MFCVFCAFVAGFHTILLRRGTSVNAMIDAIHSPHQPTYADSLQRQISLDEIQSALQKGGKSKPLVVDLIFLEFYTTHWDTSQSKLPEVLNQTFIQCTLTPKNTASKTASQSKIAQKHQRNIAQ
jgi:hypothetical protein